MALEIPNNNLGIYLINKKVSNIDIHALTSIPTVELSKLRNGLIKKIPAKKLALIALSINEDIGNVVVAIYPTLSITKHENKLNSSQYTTFGDFLNSIENNTLELISYKTGITIGRLKNLKTTKNAIPLAHEVYLIEMAIDEIPGTLFKILYNDLKLNSIQGQNTLREKEKLRSSKKSKK